MTRPVFAVGDVHGNVELLAGILEQEGILGESWDRERDSRNVTVVQLGDLVNCVLSDINHDLRVLEHVREWVDIVLLGNHEHPYFGGPPFRGFYRDPVIATELNRLERDGVLQPSFETQGVLLTHAGLTKKYRLLRTAAEADRFIRQRWREDPAGAPVLAEIGARRGGRSATGGGILWADFAERKLQNFPQLHGHTVGHKVRREGKAVCIDLGAAVGRYRIAGAWVENGEIRPVIYEGGEGTEYLSAKERMHGY